MVSYKANHSENHEKCAKSLNFFQKFWDAWKDFETEHGNEDTIREMLRVKRQVAATHNTQVNYMAAAMLAQDRIHNFFC